MPVLCGMKKYSIYALHYRQAPLNITSIAGRCLADCKCVIPGVIIFISFMHIITTDGKLTLPTSMIYPCVFYYLPSNAITLIFVMVLGYVRLMGLSAIIFAVEKKKLKTTRNKCREVDLVTIGLTISCSSTAVDRPQYTAVEPQFIRYL
ncbi:MAG: hypothetical protein EXX96DRAFT_542228 [Benjaminiella poitrasii]|nr:MAG: hypothetical protein EXX96DRAFT_542228 [Benjaminiella poitrasii]